MTNPTVYSERLSAEVAENRSWFIALGVLLIILGVIAIGAPYVTTIAVKIVLGWLFLIGGIVQIAHAFYTQSWKGFFGNLLIGLLYAAAGVWLAFFPLTGIITLTVLLAMMFIAEGILKFLIGLQVRPLDGWFWILLSGVVAIAIGIMLFMGLPSTATWAIGLLVGIDLLSSGIALVLTASLAK